MVLDKNVPVVSIIVSAEGNAARVSSGRPLKFTANATVKNMEMTHSALLFLITAIKKTGIESGLYQPVHIQVNKLYWINLVNLWKLFQRLKFRNSLN
jgi:hypothetical protein